MYIFGPMLIISSSVGHGQHNRLAGPVEACKMEPEVLVEIEEKIMDAHNMMQEVAIKTQQEEMEECIVLEEDPEMYTMAVLEFMPMANPIISSRLWLLYLVAL